MLRKLRSEGMMKVIFEFMEFSKIIFLLTLSQLKVRICHTKKSDFYLLFIKKL